MLPEGLTWGAVIAAAAADSINPCTFGILLFLLTTLAAETKKRQIILAGGAFIAAIFISYLAMGVGLCKAFSYFSVKTIFYYIVGAAAIVVGGFNIYEYTQYDKRQCKFSPLMQTIINKVTSWPMMFVAGLFCSFFLLPCTAGPYVIISGLLSANFDINAFLLLIIYNFIFVLPLILIVGLSYFGHAFIIEKFQEKLDRYAPLVLGLIMVFIGIAVIWYSYAQSMLGPVCAA